MIRTSIDLTRLPLENSWGEFLKIYLNRLLFIIVVALASLVSLLLFIFAISPNFRESVFLSQPQSVVITPDNQGELLPQQSELVAEQVQREADMELLNAQIERRQRFDDTLLNRILLLFMLFLAVAICIFFVYMILDSRIREKIIVNFQKAKTSQEH